MDNGASAFVIGSIISLTVTVIVVLLILWGRAEA